MSIVSRLQRRSRPPEPSQEMFQRIRWKLVAWYGGVLAAALILFGAALYLGARHALLSPTDQHLRERAAALAISWQGQPDLPCPPTSFSLHGHLGFWACYNAHGDFLQASNFARIAPHFIDHSLIDEALRHGSASNLIAAGPVGILRAYATTVSDARQARVLGVVEVAEPVGGQIEALAVLLRLLLALGLGTLALTSLGGLFLAHRALQPARLAYSRQREFVADASHELRTPLTMLRADAEVLLRSKNRMDPDDVAILEDMVAESEHMARLANSMLNLARLDAGEMRLERDVVDLTAQTKEMARRVDALAHEQHISIQVESQAPVIVIGDRLMLDQAILVLLDNAIKYNHPNGAVAIRTWTEGNHAYLEIRDTGIGIPAEHLPHLGERFYRVDKARTREGGGAGLGVSIARGIIRQHGGTLSLTSRPSEGTVATVVLPAVRAAAHDTAGKDRTEAL